MTRAEHKSSLNLSDRSSVEDLPGNTARSGKSDLYTIQTGKAKTEVNYMNRGLKKDVAGNITMCFVYFDTGQN